MSKLKLYGFLMSQPTRSCLMLLKESALQYEFVTVDALKGENRKPDFIKINPQGLVPFLQDVDGYSVAETSAILQYLCEDRKLEKWYSATDLKLRANTNFWTSWNHTNSRKSTKGILTTKLFPGMHKNVDINEVIAKNAKDFGRSCAFLNKHLEKNKFLAGTDYPTIADLTIVPELDQLTSEAFDLFDYTPYPNILSYLKRFGDNVKCYREVFEPVVEKAKLFKK